MKISNERGEFLRVGSFSRWMETRWREGENVELFLIERLKNGWDTAVRGER